MIPRGSLVGAVLIAFALGMWLGKDMATVRAVTRCRSFIEAKRAEADTTSDAMHRVELLSEAIGAGNTLLAIVGRAR